ncbi:hypothetical protein [Flagellimonas sediminis]|uniref:SH3 domain-containing protein n=1 Tax=Flagellimonas sediminis TaxID=2696468 RepID=A0A6I5KTK3_9FLAO|nr:hypothetical protein [Allomuricauda sediminis]NDV43335.1 hypothetical protein [Allomuricauda sediminis]
MKCFIIFFYLIPIIGFSQIQNIDKLSKDKVLVEENIKFWNDSLKRIQKALDIEIEKVTISNNQILFTKRGAVLRIGSGALSEIIVELPVNTKIYLISKEEAYLKVNSEYGEGYVFQYYTNYSKSKAAQNSISPSTNSLTKEKSSNPPTSSYKSSTRTKSYSTSRRYIRGPRGGCYYINSNGNKTYVDRSLCN